MTQLRSVSSVLTILTLSLHLGATASAANFLWDGTGTSWNSATAWSLFSNATTPNPAAKLGGSDTPILNIETVNTAQTVLLNAAQLALGLVFSSTGTVNIQTDTGTNTLTLGSGGITVNPGAGVNSPSAALSLSTPQSWTNDSTSFLSVNCAVTDSRNSLASAGSGNTTINAALGSGALKVTKNGAGTLRLNSKTN